jgi:hypothetical protein
LKISVPDKKYPVGSGILFYPVGNPVKSGFFLRPLEKDIEPFTCERDHYRSPVWAGPWFIGAGELVEKSLALA